MIGRPNQLVRRLTKWYRRARRDLPWRVPLSAPAGARPDPYHVLVSEMMLQQTQVRTVVPYFHRFLQEFPTIRDLAAADERRVLRLWQGLGYYNRCRNLLRAAQVVVKDYAGRIPGQLDALWKLPGVGRYTAGAIASLAFGRRAAIVDGNVSRVLCRIDRIESDPRERDIQKLLWDRAGELVPASNPGEFNSALMELGATICTPRSPQCSSCPVRAHCIAFRDGVQERIPAPRQRAPLPLLRRQTFCIRRTLDDGVQQWLIEQRPSRGRWAGMWQFITRPQSRRPLGIPTRGRKKLGTTTHTLTHRRYRFDVYVCDTCDDRAGEPWAEIAAFCRWVTLAELDAFPLPRPHLRISRMLPMPAPDFADLLHGS